MRIRRATHEDQDLRVRHRTVAGLSRELQLKVQVWGTDKSDAYCFLQKQRAEFLMREGFGCAATTQRYNDVGTIETLCAAEHTHTCNCILALRQEQQEKRNLGRKPQPTQVF